MNPSTPSALATDPRSNRRGAGFDLVGGGARSGKTSIAIGLAKRGSDGRIYMATAQAYDDEMRQRIARHQLERANDFRTIEVPLALVAELSKIEGECTVVIDCLTLWLSNMMMEGHRDSDILAEVDALVACACGRAGTTIVISNEVGLGIVPENELARRFRDLSGWMHQKIAKKADSVYWACFGLGLRLHPPPLTVLPREFNDVRCSFATENATED